MVDWSAKLENISRKVYLCFLSAFIIIPPVLIRSEACNIFDYDLTGGETYLRILINLTIQGCGLPWWPWWQWWQAKIQPKTCFRCPLKNDFSSLRLSNCIEMAKRVKKRRIREPFLVCVFAERLTAAKCFSVQSENFSRSWQSGTSDPSQVPQLYCILPK